MGDVIYSVGMFFMMTDAGRVIVGLALLGWATGFFERVACEIECAWRGPAYRIEHAARMYAHMTPSQIRKIMDSNRGRKQYAALMRDVAELKRIEQPKVHEAYGALYTVPDNFDEQVSTMVSEIMGARQPTVISTDSGSSTSLEHTYSDGSGITPVMSKEGIYPDVSGSTGMSQREISDQLEYAQWLANEGYTADYVRNSTALPLHVDRHGKVHIDN